MYIPVSYFGAGEGCITATGGITGSYISGGVLWKYHKFDADNFTSSSFNVISGSTLRGKLLVIGGGGSGGTTAGSIGTAAGGGGAGGVVYYEQFPIISGSYNLVVAKGIPGVFGNSASGIANNGNDGRYSSVQTPFGPYTPFTSSVIIAFGGGGGGVAGNGVTASFGVQPGLGGASGGGNAQNNNGYAIPSSSNFAGDGFGGINLNDQGNFGGSIPADTVSFNTSFMVTGGGGAGAASLSVLDTGGSGGSPQYTDGGDGLQFDIDGTSSYYAGGGGSYSSQKASNNGYTNGGLGYKNWGSGGRAQFGGGTPPPGGVTDFSESGSGGLIVFAYRLCPFDDDCITYTGTAAAAGATLTYINCYTNVTTSVGINPYESASVCSRPFVQYPYITGTGATLVSGAACTNNNPPVQCDYCIDSATGSVATLPASSSYNYIVTFSGNLPTPPNYPAGGTVYYVNNDGISSSATYTYPSVGSNPLTVCARPTTPLTFSLQSGASVSVATGSVCGRYCTAPYINTVLCQKYYGYNITKCGTTSSYDIKSYQSASIGSVFSSNAIFPYSASCYSIASTIPATLGQQLINITSSYASCNECTSSLFPTKYTLSACDYFSTGSFIVSLASGSQTASVGQVVKTNNLAISGCYSVTAITSSEGSASVSNVTFTNVYSNCVDCGAAVSQSFPVSQSAMVLWTNTSTLTGSVWYDCSGNDNHGLISGSTLTLSGSLGFSFNGTDNYITFPTSLTNQPVDDYTLMMFGTLYSGSTSRDLFTHESVTNGWDIVWDPSGNQMIYRNSPSNQIYLGYTYPAPEKILFTFALKRTPTIENVGFYINSTGSIGDSNSVSAWGTGVPFRFGWNADTGSTYFKGSISNILVFNKMLSATEISASYAFLSASYNS